MTDTAKLKKPWEIVADQTVFAAEPFLRVTQQHVITSSGQDVRDYYQVILPDFAIVCAFTEDSRVLTLWQYKHGARAFGLTFPAGIINQGETPESAAARELLEETGYRAGRLRSLGRYSMNGNQGCGHAHLFAAFDCRPVTEAQSGDLEIMQLKVMSVTEIDEAILKGEVATISHLALWGAVTLFKHRPPEKGGLLSYDSP